MTYIEEPAKQNIDGAANRVSSLPQHLFSVLALMSEGMSNGQIASKLGYKNTQTVNSLVYEVHKRLGLAGIPSRQEKRQLATEAFKNSITATTRVAIVPSLHEMAELTIITISRQSAAQIRLLLGQGYGVDAVEVVLSKRDAVNR